MFDTEGVWIAPDFAIVGLQTDDGHFMVIASDSLTEGSLTKIIDTHEVMGDDCYRFRVPVGQRFELEAKMLDVRWAIGESYAACLKNIFMNWEPKASGRRAIGGPLQIQPGKEME